MNFSISNNKKHVFMSAPLICCKKAVLPIISIFLISSISSAWSYDGYTLSVNYNVSRETLYEIPLPSSSVVNQCKSLLEITLRTPPDFSTDRSQRTAGKLTALGIILGARFALEPKHDNTEILTPLPKRNIALDNNKIKTSTRSAISIAAYRKCQKEYILGKVAYIN